MDSNNLKEVAYKVVVMIVFILMVLFCIYSFSISVFETTHGILSNSEKIIFDKGAFYLLGAAIGLIDLIWIMVYQGVLKKALTNKAAQIFSRIAASSLVIAFALPVVSHLIIEQAVLEMNYEVCTSESNTWFYLSEIVYKKSTAASFD